MNLKQDKYKAESQGNTRIRDLITQSYIITIDVLCGKMEFAVVLGPGFLKLGIDLQKSINVK